MPNWYQWTGPSWRLKAFGGSPSSKSKTLNVSKVCSTPRQSSLLVSFWTAPSPTLLEALNRLFGCIGYKKNFTKSSLSHDIAISKEGLESWKIATFLCLQMTNIEFTKITLIPFFVEASKGKERPFHKETTRIDEGRGHSGAKKAWDQSFWAKERENKIWEIDVLFLIAVVERRSWGKAYSKGLSPHIGRKLVQEELSA